MDIQEYIQSGVIESYVLGLAGPEEVAQVEDMRLKHTQVEDAINAFSLSLEQQVMQHTITPPPEIKQKVMATLFQPKSGEATTYAGNTTTPVVAMDDYKKRNTLKYLAAASVILFIVSGGLNLYLYNRYVQKNDAYQALLSERNTLFANNQVYQTKIDEYRSATQMMADPAMASVEMKDPNKKADNFATVFWDTRSKDVYLLPNKLPAPQPGKQYQLWALVDGKPVDAGVIDPNCLGACKMKNIPKAQAFAITLEQAGGSPTPTLQAMYVYGDV